MIQSAFKILHFSFLTFLICNQAWANRPSKLTYQTYFGDCPTRTAGSLALRIVRELESNISLRKIKAKLLQEGAFQKHFLSGYNISYDPYGKLIKFSFSCPRPIMKVHISHEGNTQGYSAILAANGMLFDPTYEVMLREEKKLIDDLPLLSFPIKDLSTTVPGQISLLFSKADQDLQKMLSEVILARDHTLTVILSASSRPITVFLGNSDWDKKLERLGKILSFLGPKNKIPSVVNLTNEKKVVVKFSDKT